MSNTLFDEQTFYEILEVEPTATASEIHHAYQRAKQTYSPESPALYTMFTPEEARELLKLIEEAYAVLSNQMTRKEYDQKLTGASRNKSSANSSEELPDFPVPDTEVSPMSQSSTARKEQTSQLEEGEGRTKFSNYEIDENMEQEIKEALEFDGPLLERIRTYKNVSLEKISDETRVSRTYLRALEAEDFAALPAPVFVRGFIVQVARILGLDEKAVADSYMKRMKNRRP